MSDEVQTFLLNHSEIMILNQNAFNMSKFATRREYGSFFVLALLVHFLCSRMHMSHRSVFLLSADMFIFDLPYGIIKGCAWDKRTYTSDELSTLLHSFRAIQAKPAWFVLFWVHITDAHSITAALDANGYTDIYAIHWYKPRHIAVGRKDRHVNAVEICVTARFTGGVSGALATFMDANPTKRHNLLFANATKDFLVNAEGEKINVCQKPLQIYEQLLPLYLKPGAHVMIGGFGAGGEINACIELGYNCVAFETDIVQFKAVSSWLHNYDAIKADLDAKKAKREAATSRGGTSGTAQLPPAEDEKVECHVCGRSPDGVEFGRCNRCQKWVCTLPQCGREAAEGNVCTKCEQQVEEEPVGQQENPDTDPKTPPPGAKPAAEPEVSPTV
jgi:hypothetical protein